MRRRKTVAIGRATLEEVFKRKLVCDRDCPLQGLCVECYIITTGHICSVMRLKLPSAQQTLCKLAMQLCNEGHYKTATAALKALVKK